MSVPVSISGGPGGISANRQSIDHLASLFAMAGVVYDLVLTGLRHELHSLGPLGNYGSAGLLDPAGLVRALDPLTRAVGLLDGATHDVGELGTKLRSAAAGYPWGSTALDEGVLGHVEGALHGLVSLSMGAAGAVGLHSGANAVHPRTVDLLADAARVSGADALFATVVGDGRGVAVRTGGAPVAPPRGLADVVAGLDSVDRTSDPGGIDVRVLTGRDGTRRVIVDITGTRTWGLGGSNPADLRTNAGALTGQYGAYAQGVLHALRQAGVRPDEPVMLVGHSQGGMVAVVAARHAVSSGEFAVTHVVTAGSPVARTVGRLPNSTRVLALENTRDAVPMLDGAPNPDRPNVTTAAGPVGVGGVAAAGSHAIPDSYQPLARAAEAAGGRSMTDYLDSASGFFDADSAEQHTFEVQRR